MSGHDPAWARYASIIPHSMPDRAPCRILSWSLVGCLNGQGHAVVTVKVMPPHRGPRDIGPAVITLHVEPRSKAIARIVLATGGSLFQSIPADTVAGNVVDLAQSVVADHAAMLLTPPSRRPA